MPTLTHWIVLCSLACSCQAATSASLVARYGLPVTQQFDAAPGIRVTVEYGPDRMPVSVQLAPPYYDPHIFAASTTMEADVLAGVVSSFVPAARRSQMSSQSRCSGQECSQIETDGDLVITSRFPEPRAEHGDLALSITSKRGLALTSGAIQARFGSPVVEQFVADGDIELTAKYDSTGKTEEIKVAALQPLQNLTALVVDRILNELVPLSERTGKVTHMSSSTGLGGMSFDQFDHVSISRTTLGDDLVSKATVRWLAHPPSR
jgi:hypothetical protein